MVPEAHDPDAPRRIALVCGVCTEHDAISNVVRLQERLLRDAGYDVAVFSHYSEFVDDRHIEVTDPWMLQRQPAYVEADLVILHFGIQYGLFDSLLLSHRGGRVVHFHNVTPPELLDGQAQRQAQSGIEQISIAAVADRVWSDSTHNTDCLLRWTEVESERVVPMPLSVSWLETVEESVLAEVSHPSPELELLYVGRFAAAKRLEVVVNAVAGLPADLRSRTVLRLLGSSTHSDPEYIERLRSRLDDLDVRVELEMDVPEDELRSRYLNADVFVTASAHEGFCVPVIEAMATGCEVVTTDAGALPETVGAVGRTVPVGDVAAMSSAIVAAANDARQRPPGELRPEVIAHLEQFSEDSFRGRLLEAVHREIGGTDR